MRHYSILIAEDEYWIRKSICGVIEEIYGETISILECGDGEEALDLMKRQTVSFVLTDINMPFMDGLTLISEMNQNFPRIPVIVLSGYSDYPLVRQALTSGAMDYLLKPVRREDVMTAIDKVREKILENEKDERKKKDKEVNDIMYQSHIMDYVLSTYICGKKTGGERGKESAVKEYMDKIRFPVRLILLHIKFAQEYAEDIPLIQRQYQIKQNLKKILGEYSSGIVGNAYRRQEYIILSEKTENMLMRECSIMLNRLEHAEEINTACISISNIIEKKEGLPEAYIESSLKIVSNARYAKDYQIVVWKQQEAEINPEHRISEETEKEILNAFRKKNSSLLQFLLFEQIGLARLKENDWVFMEVKQTISQLRSIVANYYIRELTSKEFLETENLFDSIDVAINRMDIREITGLLEQLICILISDRTEIDFDAGKQENLIESVKVYLDENYGEEITLTSLAEKFYVTPSYLSRTFKKETNKNLIGYLTEKRMAQAVSYMSVDSISLTEIAFLVGYSDYTYFNKVFRRYMGINPTQYRNKRQGKQNITSGQTKIS